MNAVGIDVSKGKSMIAVMRPFGEVVRSPYEVSHTDSELSELAKALNSLPGVLCGYTPTPQDAFLFGRINDGNAIALPLGLGFGWCGEVALRGTIEALFSGPFGTGYPAGDAERKMRDTRRRKEINGLVKRDFIDAMERMDQQFLKRALDWDSVCRAVLAEGTQPEIVNWLKAKKSEWA